MIHPSQWAEQSDEGVAARQGRARALVTSALIDLDGVPGLLPMASPMEVALALLVGDLVRHVIERSPTLGTEEELWQRFCLSTEA